jgi:hypothetical protein
MKKSQAFFALIIMLTFAFSTPSIQANFVQCPGNLCGAPQGVTVNNDLINGSPLEDFIDGLAGADIIFGNDAEDHIEGFEDNDLIFGGRGSDVTFGDNGDDIILPGPDVINFQQLARGGQGNDTFYVFAGEISSCLFIEGHEDNDAANFIGFGPYSAFGPFFEQGFGDGYVRLVDPIAGGRIFIRVEENGTNNVEVINGLFTPNPVVITITEFGTEQQANPCPTQAFGG